MRGGSADRDVWGGTLHNWYGPYRYKAINYPYNTSLMRVPVGTDFTKFHKYGFLWIPAQASSSGKVRGYAAYYFDDKLVSTGQQAWDPYCGEAPPPTSEHPAFGVLDRQHLALILGSGIGEPMNVQSVNVWQVSSDWNLGADTLYDIFVDLKKANAVDGPIAIDTSNPELFDGHARRVKRSTAGSASLVYSVPSIRSFAVELFEFNKPSTNVTIDVSADKSHWTNANTRSRVVVPSKHGWGRTDLMNHGKLLSGAGYLRITLSGDKGDPGDCEIGQVRIN